MHDKETSSSSFPKHVSTLGESSAQTPQPETKDDDYEYHGTESDDVRKTPKKKVRCYALIESDVNSDGFVSR